MVRCGRGCEEKVTPSGAARRTCESMRWGSVSLRASVRQKVLGSAAQIVVGAVLEIIKSIVVAQQLYHNIL